MPLSESPSGPELRIAAGGKLIYANSQAWALLECLGWRRGLPLPAAFLETVERVRTLVAPLPLELTCGEDIYSLVAYPSYGALYVRFAGFRKHAGLALAEALPHPVCSCDNSGRVLYANKPWRDYTQQNLEQGTLLSWQEYLHPEDAPRLKQIWTRATRKQAEFEAEFRYRRHDGEYRWFFGRALSIQNADGAILKWVITATDIHEAKLAASQLQQAEERLVSYKEKLEQVVAERTLALQQSLAEAQSFAHHVAHDLQGPLLSIRAFAKSTLEECAPLLGSKARDLELVINAAQRMAGFISNLLQYGKLAEQDPFLQPVDLVQLTRELIAERAEFREPRARIDIRDPAIRVRGDLVSLAQCVTNLLGNAVKFVAPGTLPHVRIFAEQGDSRYVRIVFQDNGIGIPQKHQHSIFDAFRRAAPGDYEGNGLGLAIVHRAVTRMHGRVGVESNPGQGSRFWIELPGTASEHFP